MVEEKYYLNTNTLPTIPVPLDCIIKEIQLGNDSLVFIFEDNISNNDSIKYIMPNAKSLMMKIHLVNDLSDISLYMKTKPGKILHKSSIYKEIDLNKQCDKLLHFPDNRLEYMYHNIGYCSIIVQLWASNSIVMSITADYVEYDWNF